MTKYHGFGYVDVPEEFAAEGFEYVFRMVPRSPDEDIETLKRKITGVGAKVIKELDDPKSLEVRFDWPFLSQYVDTKDAGRVLRVELPAGRGNAVKIGWGLDCGIRLRNDIGVSEHHACIVPAGPRPFGPPDKRLVVPGNSLYGIEREITDYDVKRGAYPEKLLENVLMETTYLIRSGRPARVNWQETTEGCPLMPNDVIELRAPRDPREDPLVFVSVANLYFRYLREATKVSQERREGTRGAWMKDGS